MDPEVVEQIETPEVVAPEVVAPEVVKPAAETPASEDPMGDSIRAKFKELSKPAEEVKPVEPPKPGKDGRLRDPQGRYLKADGTVDENQEETPEVVPEVVAPVAEKPVIAPKPGEVDFTKPPTSLKGDVQAMWGSLDPKVQAEFHRREADFHKGLTSYKEMADIGKILDAEIRPYEAMIRAANTNPQSVIRDFMNTAYQLKTGTPESKIAVMLEIASNYGVDLTNLQVAAEQQAAGRPQVDPQVVQLQQELGSIKKTFEDQKRAEVQRQYAELQNETVAFSQKPENRFYDKVKLDMAALIESGRADGLQDAYDKAVWANSEVRAVLLSEQKAAEQKQKADKAALARKAASTNVAPRGTLPPAPVVGTMEDTIRNTFRKLNGS
mgnify:CR=1 FL=1